MTTCRRGESCETTQPRRHGEHGSALTFLRGARSASTPPTGEKIMKVKAAVPHTTLAVPIDRSNSGPTSHSARSKSTEPHLIMPKSAVGAVIISGAQLSRDHVRAAVSLHVKSAPLDLAASVVVRFGAKARSPSRQGRRDLPRDDVAVDDHVRRPARQDAVVADVVVSGHRTVEDESVIPKRQQGQANKRTAAGAWPGATHMKTSWSPPASST